MNIDVLSFARLAFRVLEETGNGSREILDDEGKNLILRRLAGKKEDSLKVLKGNIKKPGYISEVKSVISELTQYNISPDGMDDMITEADESSYLAWKLKDIQVMYQAFEEYLADKYITKEEILEIVEKSQGKKIRLTIIRNGFKKECQILPVRMQDGSCKLGVWVRDDTQGLGTMTYVDGQKQYGALGHGISDVDTGLLMQIRDGKLYRASVGAVKKGEKGNPGELSGTIYYRDDQILGTITSNSETGIKGMLYAMPQELSGHSYRQEVHTGNASIYCSIDGSVKEYTVEIEKINLSHRDINKSMVIRVKDQDLLEKTGGIVQGMSGSPILQDGKLIGAVTHVFVADPSRGYAIFAENMLEK